LLALALLAAPVPAADNRLTEAEQKAGWILLFDGNTLDGWMTSSGKSSARPVDDHCLNPHRCGGYMMIHKKTWGNFVLACDFKISKGCNSGIFVRTWPLKPRPNRDVGFNGIEVQILDSKTAGYHDTGAIYDLVKPTRNAMKPVGQWNHIVITCDRNLIAVELNGEKVNRMDLDEWKQPSKRPDGSPHKFDIAYRDHPRQGYIGLQDHGSDCWFKNIKLKPLKADPFDVLIRGGTVYDGSGEAPRRADLGIRGDRVAAVGDLAGSSGKVVIDARGLAVAPGFINMLSWSNDSLLVDGRGQSEVRQGVTTQIMGEGWSWGPVNAAIKKRMKADQTDIKYEIEWTTLSGYLSFLERKGVSQNVASFLGATTVREYVLGLANKQPTAEELDRMRRLVRQEMRDGALGIATALEYAPAYYANTEELIELCKVAAQYRGKYITHMRSEGERLLEGIDEVIRISREAKIPAEIYHIKAAGKSNWPKMDAAIARITAARRRGLPITANMYCYTAGAAPLTACIPPWAMEGGERAMRRRLRESDSRKRILHDIRDRTDWPNFYHNAGSPDNVMLVSFKQKALKPLQGRTLAQIARLRGKDPVETLLDLLVEDESSIGTVYFITAEENIRKLIPLPWISFGSDEAAQEPEGVFLRSMPHPRAYGNFARLLGKYVRDEKLLPLAEAVRKLTSLPATNLGLDHRGLLRPGYFADVVVFDPKTIADRATYARPHQYAVGVRQVFVNGVQVLRDSEHTGAKPGRALWGPGKADK
jgi:N-acyl-D-amino-acid deacylase